MKLSVTTLGCPDWSFAKILDEVPRIGFAGIEIRGVDGKMRAEEIEAFSAEHAEATKALVASKHLEMMGFGTSVMFHDDEKFDAALIEGRLAIDVAQQMGIPAIRVFGDKIDGDAERVIANVVKGMGELCDYAEGKSVDVLLEIHGNFNTIESVQPVIEQLKDKPAFGILWDIEHSDKTYGDNWRAFYDVVKPYVRHTHIKDHHRADGQFLLCLTGEGDIPIADIVNTLRADGYDGWYSLEWEKKWHPELPEPEIAFPGYVEFMKGI